MTIFDNYEVWFVIGSQHLYGPETLRQVTQHAEHVVNALNTEAKLPCKLVLKPLGTTPDEITAICRDANYDDRCGLSIVPPFTSRLYSISKVQIASIFPCERR